MKKVQVSEEFFSKAGMLAVLLKDKQLSETERRCVDAILAEFRQKTAAKDKRQAYGEYKAAKGKPEAKRLLEEYLNM